MRLPFRHGIVKYTVDNKKQPTFLEADPRDQYVSLRGDIDNVLLNFAYYDANYLFQETKATSNAWGPLRKDIKYWLYWDINKLTGERTFGFTKYQPIVSDLPPVTARAGQHWFDTVDVCMKVWSGKNWTPYIRLFACTYFNGYITAYPLSSQINNFDACEAGAILFSDLNTPAQQTTVDDTYKFLTDVSPFSGSKSVTTTVSLDQSLRYGVAGENIPKNTLVSIKYDGTIQIASYLDPNKSAVVGIVDRDVAAGETCYYKSTMYLSNYSKTWDVEPSSPLYLGLFGYINQRPPLAGYIQKVGTVVSPTVAYIDISFHNIHYESFQKQPIPLSVDILTGKFYIKQDGVIPSSTDVFIDETIIIEEAIANGTTEEPPVVTPEPTTPQNLEPSDPYESNNVLFLTFEDTEGSTTFTDLSSAKQVAKIFGSPVITTSNKKFGNSCLSLNGVDAYLYYDKVFSSINTTTMSFSIDFWYYPTSLTVNGGACVLGINAANAGNRNVIVLGKDFWVDHAVEFRPTTIMLNVWNHIAIVSDGTNMSLYINGVKSHTCPPPVTPLSDCVLGIGAEFDSPYGGTPGNWAPGFVDRFRVTANVVRFTSDFNPDKDQSSGGTTSTSGGGGIAGTTGTPVVPIPDHTGRLYNNVQALVYEFTIKNFTWNITHDYRLPNFVVQTYDTNNELMEPVSIKATSSSNIQITFAKPVAGTATLFIY